MKLFTFLLFIGVCLNAAGKKDQKPALPAPYHTPSATNPPKIVPQPDGRSLQVPAGFTVEPYAKGFSKPRIMLELPNGAVLVTDAIPKGSVIALTNNGKDRKPLLEGLDRPFGLALHQGYLYVSEAEAIKRYRLDTNSMSLGPAETVVALTGYNKGHWTRSIAFDPKTNRMYVSVGSGSNVDPGDPKDRAAINVYNPDGSGHEIFATGLRNPVSIKFHPRSNKLWATVQERDGLGDDLVPDFFTEVKRGGFYGWPFAYIGPNEEPRNAGQAPGLVKSTLIPDVVLTAHVAAMDFTFYQGKQFPARYRDGAFVALRGSGNRSSRVGYSVVFIPFRNGKPAGAPEEFLAGWMLDPSQREVWGRPVGVTELRDGSLLVSEDGNNEIWRVSFKGK
jgi:glucose/arabinose dehydrogenase